MKTSNNSKEKKSPETNKLKRQVSRLKKESERLQALLNVAKNLSAEMNLDNLLIKIMDEVRKMLEADRCTVFLFDEGKKELWSKVALGLSEEIRIHSDQGIAGHVFNSGETVNIPDAYKDSRFNPEIDQKTGYKTKSMLTMPLQNRFKETIGVFQVLNKKGGSFTKVSEEVLEAVASIATSAIENAQLYDEQKKSFTSFIETLSTTLDTRDYITAGHSRRVTLYAIEIAPNYETRF